MARNLGTYSITSSNACGSPNGVPVDNCLSCVVTIPGEPNMTGTLKVTNHSGSLKGTLVCFSGGGGGAFYQAAFTNSTGSILLNAQSMGFNVVQVAWVSNVFSGSTGPLNQACRTATLLRAIFDTSTIHTSGSVFAVLGNSGGSSQIAYSLSHYNADEWIDLAIMTSGPPHARLDYGSIGSKNSNWSTISANLRTVGGGLQGFTDGPTSAQFIDASYGDISAVRSCGVGRLMGGDNVGYNDSVYNSRAKVIFPKTSVYFIYADGDSSEAVPLGRHYANAIRNAVINITSGSAQHDLPNYSSGQDFINTALSSSFFRH